MNILKHKKLICFGVVLISILLYIYWNDLFPIDEKDLPILSVAIGETIDETQKHSTYDLQINKYEKVRENDSFALDLTPARFEFRHPKYGFTFSVTRLAFIYTENYRVARILLFPQKTLLNLTDSKAVIKKFIILFNKLGWTPDLVSYPVTPLEKLNSDSFSYLNETVLVAGWMGKDIQSQISIKRIFSVHEFESGQMTTGQYAKKPYQDYYSIEVSLYKKRSSSG